MFTKNWISEKQFSEEQLEKALDMMRHYCGTKYDTSGTRYNIHSKNKNKLENFLGIKSAYFNNEKTVIIWNDGTKTILNRNSEDIQDYEKAILWAYALHNSRMSKNKLASGLSKLIRKDEERKAHKLKKELNKKNKQNINNYLRNDILVTEETFDACKNDSNNI